ncbi:MAG: FAD-dependent thymidylate synthase [Candidatus Nanoarchaeia archaeon]
MKVKLLNHMGSDIDIEKSARISYDKFDENRTKTDTERLIRFLWWHRHTSPFEHVVFTFLIECPIFVARHIMRHRTASINEISRRYTNENIKFYVDNELKDTKDFVLNSFYKYQTMLANGVRQEIARGILPQSMLTKFVWTINLRNLFHFLDLRLSENTQRETRDIAKKILELIQPVVPIATKAFLDWKTMKDEFYKDNYERYKHEKI